MVAGLIAFMLAIASSLVVPLCIIVGIVFIARRTGKKTNQDFVSGQIDTQNSSYLYGYWAGRKSLRDEVASKLEGSEDAPTKAELLQLVDQNQWSPGSETEVIDTVQGQAKVESVPSAQITPVATVSQPVDYGVPLLYLGAFLFITAATLFVTLSGVGGGAKVFLLAAVAAVFYASGQVLFRSSTRLKNAGSSFVAVAVLLTPLLGVAAYGYWLNQQYGLTVWLVTSLICLSLYAITWLTMKQQYIGYLMIGALVSLVESAVAQLGLPAQAFGWGLSLVAVFNLGLWSLGRSSEETKQLQAPLMITANVLLPVSILYSLALIGDKGFTQNAAILALASAFYATYGLLLGRGARRVALWVSSQLLALLAAGVLTYGVTESRNAVLIYIVAASLLYNLIALISRFKRVAPSHYEGVFSISAVSLPIALLCLSPWPRFQLAFLIVAIVQQWLLWRASKSDGLVTIGVFYSFLLPASAILTLMKPTIDQSEVAYVVAAVLYTVFASALYVLSTSAKGIEAKIVYRVSTPLFMAVSLVTALASGSTLIVAGVLLASVGLSLLACYRYKLPEFLILAASLFYFAVLALCVNQSDAALLVQSCWFLLAGAWAVTSGFLSKLSHWASSLRIVAIIGFALSLLAGSAPGAHWALGALSVTGIGTVIIAEGLIRRQLALKELGGAIVMVSVQWFLYQLGLREFLVYSHLWALLALGYSMYRQSVRSTVSASAYLYTSLSIATVPFALMLLGGVDVLYGWLFIAEHIGVVLLGAIFKRRGVIWWGLCSVILAVLYQLRDLQFVALGLLSLFVIGIAIYVSVAHTKKDE